MEVTTNELKEEISETITKVLNEKLKGKTFHVIISWCEGESENGFAGTHIVFGKLSKNSQFGEMKAVVGGLKIGAEYMLNNFRLEPTPIEKKEARYKGAYL